MRKRETSRLLKKILVSVLAAAMLVTAPGMSSVNVKAADSDVVEIPDEKFKARLNRELKVSDETADITKGQLATIKQLINLDSTITNIQGIEYCVNLERFGTFIAPGLTDLTPIQNLTKLREIRLYDSGVADLSPLEKLTNLTELDVEDSNNISDISVVAKLPNLAYLNISKTGVADLSPIKDLTNLEGVDIASCKNVTDISALENLTKLTELNMSGCSNVTDVSALGNLRNLTYLNMGSCSKVADVSALGTLVNLETLYLNYVKAADISALQYLTKLKKLDLYSCAGVTDLSPLSGLTSLEDLELEHTGLADVAPADRRGTINALSTLENMKQFSWSFADVTDEEAAIIFKNMDQLEYASLGFNKFTDASFLLPSKETLKELTLAGNHELEDTEAIAQLKKLKTVGVDNTKITDFSFVSELPNMTNDSIRFNEWEEDLRSRTNTYTKLNVFVENGSNQVTYSNCIRNEKGELVAPDAEDIVAYDASTGKITVEMSKYHDANVDHTFGMVTQKGYKIYVVHTTTIYDRTIDIKTQPQDKEVEENSSYTLSVSAETRNASDSKGLRYQWYKDGTVIAGATSSSYKIDSMSEAEVGNYHVVVSNEWGSVTSEAASVSVKEVEETPLVITKQPTNITLDEGATGSISVVATGDGLTYQWYKDGNAIAGATSAALNLASVTTEDAGNYKVVVTDTYGKSVTSNTVAVTVNERAELTIVNHPADEVLNEGESTTLSVYAEGEAPLTYQWYKDGVAIEGATEASFSLSNVTAEDAGSYKVVVTDAYGETAESNAATITVNVRTPLAITKQPESLTLDEGANGSLAVEATGDEVTYQWYKDSTAIEGATGATLSFAGVTAEDVGTYKVAVTDKYGASVTSEEAKVTVAEKEEPENPDPVDPEKPDPEDPEKPEEVEKPNKPEPEKPSETPETGDTSSTMLYVVIMGCAVLAAVAAMRKRRTN